MFFRANCGWKCGIPLNEKSSLLYIKLKYIKLNTDFYFYFKASIESEHFHFSASIVGGNVRNLVAFYKYIKYNSIKQIKRKF